MHPLIRVVAHDPAWASQFMEEAARVEAALGEVAVRVRHIGSTSVPGIRAKPVVDILLEVTSLAALDAHTSRLEVLGYEAKGEFGIAGRRYFRRDDSAGVRTHQIHAFEPGAPNVLRHIAFRDYLRAHPAVAAEYGALKERLALAHPNDMVAYMDGKDAFIKEHEKRAVQWMKATGTS
jgi:GrpB-like predicted nucleotidyltransferase (UPF0157 family)